MLIDDGLLPEDFATTTERNEPKAGEQNNKWYHKNGKRMLKFGLHLCHVRFEQHLDDTNADNRDPLWSDLLYCFHYYISIKLTAVVYHQYVLDYHNYKLSKFDQTLDRYRHGLSHAQAEEVEIYRHHLVADCESARGASKLLGAPFMHFNYILENALIYLIILVNCQYLVPQFFKSYIDFTMIYMFFAPDKLKRSVDSLICNRVNSFIESSRLYNVQKLKQKRNSRPRPADVQEDFANQISVHKSLRSHKFLVEQVKHMARKGWLQPYNRRADRVREMLDIASLVFVTMLPASLGLWVLFEFVIPHSNLLSAKIESGPMDTLLRIEMLLFSVMGSFTTCIYLPGSMMICIDQAYSVSRLCSLINECMSNNTLTMAAYLRHPRLRHTVDPSAGVQVEQSASIQIEGAEQPIMVDDPSYDELEKKLNLSLMYTLMHYKIFVKLLRMQFKAFPVFATIILLVTYTAPLGSRLLVAYMDQTRRRLAILASLVMLIVCNASLVMVCWLHERCLDIYRHLQSLMAHTVAMDSLAQVHIKRRAYDEHLTAMLRRELDHPEKLTDQFSTRLLIVQTNMTYASLIKYLFWWGILILSLMIIDPSRPDARDVFGGIWRYYGRGDAEVERFFAALGHYSNS